MKWAPLEPRPQDAEPPSTIFTDTPGVLDQNRVFMPGSGMAKKLYSLGYVK